MLTSIRVLTSSHLAILTVSCKNEPHPRLTFRQEISVRGRQLEMFINRQQARMRLLCASKRKIKDQSPLTPFLKYTAFTNNSYPYTTYFAIALCGWQESDLIHFVEQVRRSPDGAVAMVYWDSLELGTRLSSSASASATS